MITDDRELAELFRARTASFPQPSPALFTVTMQRLDANASQGTAAADRAHVIARLRRTRFGALALSRSGAIAAAIAACIILAVTFSRHDTTQAPVALFEPAIAPKVDPSYDRSAPAAPMPKQINVNTLKSSSRTMSTNTGVPAAATESDAVANHVPDAAIARTESLGLLVRSVPDAIAAINGIAKTHGGMVIKIDDNAPDDPDSPRTATLSLTVAAPQLDAATTRILAIGAIQSRSATAEAIGDSIVDDQARLRNLRREETDLLRIMDRSGSVQSILDVESKLADVRGQIEQLTAHLANSNHRVATSQLDVTLTESKPAAAPATPSLGDHVTATWNAALRSIRGLGVSIVDGAIWVTAYLPVVLVAALIAAFVMYRRRSRF